MFPLQFVAHPNVQQLLAAIWYEGLPGFRRKQGTQQLMDVIKLGCSFPIYSLKYILAPDSEGAKFMRKPFVKFITHSCSYMFFLSMLTIIVPGNIILFLHLFFHIHSAFGSCFVACGTNHLWIARFSLDADHVGRLAKTRTWLVTRTHWAGYYYVHRSSDIWGTKDFILRWLIRIHYGSVEHCGLYIEYVLCDLDTL